MSFRNGFTLVELAIVMTIVGLLIGGVLKGQELLENSRMGTLASQLKSYEGAITTFRDIYKGIPGDHNNATNVLKGCIAGNNCANGDGNGIVGTGAVNWHVSYDSSESFQIWKHLVLAELIKGVDPSRARVAATYNGGIDVPASPLGGQIFAQTITGVDDLYGFNGITAYLSGDRTGGWTGTTLFTPATALKVDLKIDDGIAFSGTAKAVSSGWTSGCGTSGNGTVGYNVNTGGRACDMGFLITR